MAKNGVSSGTDTSSLKVAKADLARELLREVGEEARASFPRQFTETELVLIDVDPTHLHAFWNVPISAMGVARTRPGATEAPMILRLFPLAEGPDGGAAAAPIDIEVGGLQGRTYVGILQSERRYRGMLGLRVAAGTFAPLATSNEIALPPVGPAADPAPHAPPVPTPETAAGTPVPDPFPQLFDLEAILPVSSYILAGDRVAFEAVAELHINGRAEPGTTVRLFGREVPLRPDGSFSVVHVLAHDSPLLASLLAAAAAEPEGAA